MIHLVTFATDDMSRAARLCVESGWANGVVSHGNYSPANMLHCENMRKHWPAMREMFKPVRGAGYWFWKPMIISSNMETLQDGDILIYSDSGIEFLNNVNYIIDRMDQDIFLFGNNWEHAHWCKRDIIESLWPDPKLSDDPPQGYFLESTWRRFGKQVQASVIFFRVSDYTRKFVKEWLDWCLFEGGRLIDDSPSRTPNHPEFQENRHDQAILTTMAYREGIKLHWWPAVYNKGGSPEFVYERGDYTDEGYPVLFSHHRKRNHEFEVAA